MVLMKLSSEEIATLKKKENSCENNDYITFLSISESGGTVLLKRVTNVERQPPD